MAVCNFIIPKAFDVYITLLALDQPKHLEKMAVNTGIKVSHRDGSHPQRTKKAHHDGWSMMVKATTSLRILPKGWYCMLECDTGAV